MNINLFFVCIIGALCTIFFAFKPLDIKKQSFGEIPVFELDNFSLVELNKQGLSTIMNGTDGVRYEDRYLVSHIDYTDNTKKDIANMIANTGVYKGKMIDLEGDVVFSGEDGISFSTQSALYDKKTSTLTTSVPYIAFMGKHKVHGSSMQYNSDTSILKSKNIVANYKLKER